MEHGAEIFAELGIRTRQALALLVSGYTTDQDMAAALGVSKSTIHIAVGLAFDATGMGNRVELALFVERNTELKRLLLAGFTVPQ